MESKVGEKLGRRGGREETCGRYCEGRRKAIKRNWKRKDEAKMIKKR